MLCMLAMSLNVATNGGLDAWDLFLWTVSVLDMLFASYLAWCIGLVLSFR